MKFYEKLKDIMDKVNANQSDLVKNSNLSSSLISRYCNGTRTPKYNSKQLVEIINALYIIGVKNNIRDISLDNIREEFDSLYDVVNIDAATFVNNFNSIIEILDIKIYELANYISYDPSYISKIRNEYILPRNITNFSSLISKYIISFYSDDISKKNMSNLFKCKIKDIDSDDKYGNMITLYLCNNNVKGRDSTYDFLKELDSFDLNEFYNKINYSKMKVITLPIERHKVKEYYGFSGYKRVQSDMLKTIIFSKSKEDVFFYSNMSITNASKDNDFKNSFIKGISYILKKGIHINMVHDLDRPFEELIIGLVGWIPLYMTGMINPYYFKNNSNGLYSTLKVTSGSASLFGHCIAGNMNSGKFILSTRLNDVKYSKDNSLLLLKKAKSLMKIYTIDNKDNFNKLLDDNLDIIADRRNILYDLPIYTIDSKLLDKILNRNKVSNSDKERIKKYYNKEKERINKLLENNIVYDELNIESFDNHKLSLTGLFYDKEILYTKNEFKKHLECINTFKNNNKNYNYSISDKHIFKNINIYIAKDKYVIISKAKSPTIHFYIVHPKLIDAVSKLNVSIM